MARAKKTRVVDGFEITSAIPMPTGAASNRPSYRAAMEALRPGESFLARGRSKNAATTLCSNWSKKLGRRFVCRPEGDQWRVWRIK